LLAAYAAGQRSLEDLAREFRGRSWPPVPPVCPPGLEATGPAIDDPEPYVPGSFDDVVLAYDLGSGCMRPGQIRKEHVRAGVGYHAASHPPV
jgi:hypothetical protein